MDPLHRSDPQGSDQPTGDTAPLVSIARDRPASRSTVIELRGDSAVPRPTANTNTDADDDATSNYDATIAALEDRLASHLAVFQTKMEDRVRAIVSGVTNGIVRDALDAVSHQLRDNVLSRVSSLRDDVGGVQQRVAGLETQMNELQERLAQYEPRGTGSASTNQDNDEMSRHVDILYQRLDDLEDAVATEQEASLSALEALLRKTTGSAVSNAVSRADVPAQGHPSRAESLSDPRESRFSGPVDNGHRFDQSAGPVSSEPRTATISRRWQRVWDSPAVHRSAHVQPRGRPLARSSTPGAAPRTVPPSLPLDAAVRGTSVGRRAMSAPRRNTRPFR